MRVCGSVVVFCFGLLGAPGCKKPRDEASTKDPPSQQTESQPGSESAPDVHEADVREDDPAADINFAEMPLQQLEELHEKGLVPREVYEQRKAAIEVEESLRAEDAHGVGDGTKKAIKKVKKKNKQRPTKKQILEHILQDI